MHKKKEMVSICCIEHQIMDIRILEILGRSPPSAQPLLPSVRLNKISSVVPDEPDLLRHVTQLDVRDNRLTELDACVFPKLETLHCERNRIACLKAKGSFLKGIYASSNGGFSPRRDMCG